jgi:hypothetical protein
MKLVSVSVKSAADLQLGSNLHRIILAMAPDEAVKIFPTNLEVPVNKIKEVFCVFRVGMDVAELVTALRTMADYLERFHT